MERGKIIISKKERDRRVRKRSGRWPEKWLIALFIIIILVYILVPFEKEAAADPDLYGPSLSQGDAGTAAPTTPDGRAQRRRMVEESREREESLKRMQDQLLTDPCPRTGPAASSILEQLNQQALAEDFSLTEELLPETGPPAELLKESEPRNERFKHYPPLLKGSGGKAKGKTPPAATHYQNSPFIFYEDGKSIESGSPCIFEGSLIEAVVEHRVMVDDRESPVTTHVSRDIYSDDRQHLLIPRGSRFIGKAQVVAHQNQHRLYTLFHRLILPDGGSIDFEKQALGMDRSGSFGIASKINRHTFKKYKAALFMGVLDGLGALAQNRIDQASPWSWVMSDTERNLSAARSDVLRRDLRIKPTITIKPGTRIKIYLCRDIHISPYQAQEAGR